MSDYKFSANQRYAIFTAHREKCYLCTTPIDLQSMEVDHILPESLLKNQTALSTVLNLYGLDSSFDLNTPDNWLPACSLCNGAKSNTVFEPTPIIQLLLQHAKSKSSRVIELIDKSIDKGQINRALNVLERVRERGELTEEHIEKIQPLLAFHITEREPELAGQPIKMTPLYTILREDSDRLIIQGPAGVGVRPKGQNVHHSWDCPRCGSIAAWNGARCVICGMMDDGD